MFLWFAQRYAPFWNPLEQPAAGDPRASLTLRAALAALTAFLMALLLGPTAIDWLRRRFRERIASDSARLNALHASKRDTPTMGGLFILAAMAAAVALWGDLANRYLQLGLATAALLGGLGALDDWIKLSQPRNGLAPRQKLCGQVVLCLALSAALYALHQGRPLGTHLVMPVGTAHYSLGAAFIGWALLVLVGSSNAVNLTDGLDGLAAGCTIFAGLAFAGLTYVAGHKVLAEYLNVPYIAGAGEFSVVLGAMVGATLGFLWFNCFPAQIFMGDTGALALGGLIGMAALVARQELLLLLVGGVFVAETLCVILQVAWFKATARRLFACSPLHNHLLFRGHHETKVVARLWIAAALLAIAGLASLKIR